jgi:hypothetical protein
MSSLDHTIRQVLEELVDAAEVYSADQSGATDLRCGLVQPVTVAEANELNRALTAARKILGIRERDESGE